MKILAAHPFSTSVLMLLLATPLLAQADNLLRIASDDWCPFVCARDGKLSHGYLIDVTAQAMALSGYRVQPVLMPLTRAIREAGNGNIEAVYAPPIDQRLRLSMPIAYSRSCFYTQANNTWKFHGIDSLHGIKLGVIDDYGYDNDVMDAYIAKNHNNIAAIELSSGDTAGTNNVQKLLGGRHLVMLEHQLVMTRLVKHITAAKSIREAGCLEQALPLTIGFAKQDARVEDWNRALADGLKKMNASGALKTLQRHHNISAKMVAGAARKTQKN